MKTKLKFILLFLFPLFVKTAEAQKASDVLEKGLRIHANEQMIIQYNPTSKQLEYSLNVSFNDGTKPFNFKPLEDGLLLLNQSENINVYTYPVNPLNYSFAGNVSYIEDPIDAEAAKALSGIVTQLGKFGVKQKDTVALAINKGVVSYSTVNEDSMCKAVLSASINEVKQIIALLETDQKTQMVKLFKELKALKFEEQKTTLSDLVTIKGKFDIIEAHFQAIVQKLDLVAQNLKGLDCNVEQNKFNKILLDLVIKDTRKAYSEQLKRFKNFYGAYELVKKAADEYATGGGTDGLRWCKPLPRVKTKRGEIGSLSVKLAESGLALDADEEIIAVTTKELAAKEVKFRRFQRFVPEVSAGVAYTFFKYKTYGTTTDAAGQQVVSEASEEEVKNINVTSMLNFTYYIENSNVNPFWQIGIGANADVPTLLTGFGLRGVLGTSRICLSGGIAMTWIKELQDLKLGDPVDGTTAIENDLKPVFSWPPKAYIGIQYNF